MGRPTPITSEQQLSLVAEYNAGVSRNQLALNYGASRPFVTDCLKRHGVVLRSVAERCPGLPVDHAAFDDAAASPESAYWVGFLMADGCISDRGPASPHVIVVLGEQDRPHLVQFRAFLRSEHSIQHVPPSQNARIKGGPCVRLDIVSPRMVESLARYGVVPRKSLRATAIGLEHNKDFWRGVVDGDGWVGLAKRRGRQDPRLNITGSLPLATQWAAFVKTITPTACQPARDRNAWQCGVTGRHAVRVLHALYSDCHVALPRKLQAAQTIIQDFARLLDSGIGYHW